jgi:hypothetical protein
MKTDVEQSLRTLRWRDPPPEFLKHSLEVALAESNRKRRVSAWLAFSAATCSSNFFIFSR